MIFLKYSNNKKDDKEEKYNDRIDLENKN
jgi:hypothetical protein